MQQYAARNRQVSNHLIVFVGRITRTIICVTHVKLFSLSATARGVWGRQGEHKGSGRKHVAPNDRSMRRDPERGTWKSELSDGVRISIGTSRMCEGLNFILPPPILKHHEMGSKAVQHRQIDVLGYGNSVLNFNQKLAMARPQHVLSIFDLIQEGACGAYRHEPYPLINQKYAGCFYQRNPPFTIESHEKKK